VYIEERGAPVEAERLYPFPDRGPDWFYVTQFLGALGFPGEELADVKYDYLKMKPFTEMHLSRK
jgi:hypothetical protein